MLRIPRRSPCPQGPKNTKAGLKRRKQVGVNEQPEAGDTGTALLIFDRRCISNACAWMERSRNAGGTQNFHQHTSRGGRGGPNRTVAQPA